MAANAIHVTARTLTPFAYHSLMVQSGTATLPELIGDRAAAFGLAAALGMTAARVALPQKDYRSHLAAMPWRTSVFTTDDPQLLPPVTRRLNLDAEAGIQAKVASVAKRGNLKDFFHTQEVPRAKSSPAPSSEWTDSIPSKKPGWRSWSSGSGSTATGWCC